MPKNNSIKKVLVIGSGPIVIGQAAEFDYAGTQACRSLKEEGIEVVLVNSNPATIMTDKQIADKVYIEPLTTEVLKKIIKKEEPDSILPTLGGQAALNLAMELDESGFLVENRVRMIGTSSQTIKKAEDRLAFKETMEKIGEPCAASEVCTTLQGCFDFAEKNGYPVVIRPAYTLGGSGGGIAQLARSRAMEALQMGGGVGYCPDPASLDGITARSVAEAARQGDPAALEVYRTSGELLGEGLSILIDVLNPETIVIGSIFARAHDLLWPAAESVIRRQSLSYAREVCRVVPAGLGEQIGDYAALSVAVYTASQR